MQRLEELAIVESFLLENLHAEPGIPSYKKQHFLLN